MKAPGRLPVVIAAFVVLAHCWIFGGAASGADPPVRKMLDGLRHAKYYDMATFYLERMRESDDCPAEFQETIDYELGTTLLEAAKASESASARESLLDQATEAIQRFLKEHPTHDLAGVASMQLGRELLMRGAGRVLQSEQPGLSAKDKEIKLTEARQFFDQAKSAMEEAENRCYQTAKQLEERKKTDPSTRAEEDFQEACGELLQARLLLVKIAEQKARSYAPDSKEYQEQLAAVADRYKELFEKNEEFKGGLQARNLEGKVRRDLGKNDEAVEIFKDVLVVPGGDQDIRNLKQQAILWMMETFLKPDVKKYDEAIETAALWKDEALPNEASSNEGLQIQLLAGQACLEAAKALKEDDEDGRRNLLRSARRYLEFVQRSKEFRKEATDLLADELLGAADLAEVEPTTFEEAFEQASVAWLKFSTTLGQLQQATDAKKKAELTDQLANTLDATMKNCRLGLELANEKTDESQVNTLRFYLAYLYFKAERLFDAAVMGEVLAYRYPQSMGARKGAEIAIAAYRTMFDAERRANRDTTFEMAQMQRVANYVIGRWSDDPVAERARLMLFDTAVDSGDVDKAREFLEQLPADSTSRANAELRLGQMYWSKYVRQTMLEGDERPSQEELDALVQSAQETLRQGIDRMSKAVDEGGEPNYSLALSVLTLAQILIDAGNPQEAVRWLDDPKIGPMTLLAAKSPAVAGRTDFQIDVYKAALRAYVGTEKLQQAEAVMSELEDLVGKDDSAGATRLTQIYISLGRQLEEMLKRLRAEGKTEQIEKVSQGFEKFLDTISKREQGNSFRSLNWVAQTFSSLAAGLDPGEGTLPPAALKYYKSAGETYLKLLKNPPEDMPDGAETALKVQLAICLRALGRQEGAAPERAKKNFVQALGLLVGILQQREGWVDVQKEAARTYQEMARATNQPDYYTFAILGGQKQPDGKLLVWGWNGISRRVAGLKEYLPEFYEARYNIALCRMRLAQSQKGEEQAKTLKMAESDIEITHKLYPLDNDKEWFDKFDSVLKAIRKFQGNENPQGLAAAE